MFRLRGVDLIDDVIGWPIHEDLVRTMNWYPANIRYNNAIYNYVQR
jgi:hypothetical protein